MGERLKPWNNETTILFFYRIIYQVPVLYKWGCIFLQLSVDIAEMCQGCARS